MAREPASIVWHSASTSTSPADSSGNGIAS
jgi:hypothetical protein